MDALNAALSVSEIAVGVMAVMVPVSRLTEDAAAVAAMS